MITRSDNTATNTIISEIGMPILNQEFLSLGLGATVLKSKLNTTNSKIVSGNMTTISDINKLLAGIAKNTIVTQESSQKMLAILGGQLDKDKIAKFLPKGAKIYNKTGERTSVTHDASILEINGKKYVLSIFTNDAPGSGSSKIASFAKSVFASVA